MSGMLMVAILVLAVLLVWVVMASLAAQKKSQNVEMQMGELRRGLETVATAQAPLKAVASRA